MRLCETLSFFVKKFLFIMSDQEDGLFGFDFDEQDFVTKQPTKVELEKINYEAKIETDGVSE